MNIDELLDKLRGANVDFLLEGDELRVSAPKGALNAELRDLLSENKAAIVDALSAAQRATKISVPPITRLKPSRDYPASFAQERLWFMDQLEPGSVAYNMPLAIRLRGGLCVPSLIESLNAIARRHQTLRTRFVSREGRPVQLIDENSRVELKQEDLGAMQAEIGDAELELRVQQEAFQPFDLSAGPLLRGRLLRLSDHDHVLLLTMHHIISDGWSLGILFRELGACYAAFSEGKQPRLPELPIQYADFAFWQRDWLRGEVLDSQMTYWQENLRDLTTLDLPTDRPRPPVQTYAGAVETLTLDAELTVQLGVLSKQAGATLFMTLLGAYAVLMHRYSGQDDIVIGSPIANRNRSEVEGLIGFFINMLVLRLDVSGNPGFRELLGRVQKTALGAYQHQDIPFEKLVEVLQPTRERSRNPLFQVQFALQNAPMEPLQLKGLILEPISREVRMTRFDLECHLWENSDGLEIFFVYNRDLFDANSIRQMLGHYRNLLQSVVAEPDRRIVELSMLSEPEQQQLTDWNQTATDYPRDKTVAELFEVQAVANPQAVAVDYAGETLSYAELNGRANRLAHYLRRRGVGPEVMVGVYLERGPEMVVGLLGILKAGGAYVPLDLDYPQSRISFMLEDAGVPVLLSVSGLSEQLPDFAGELVCLDRDWAGIEQESAANPGPVATADNLAYVIYTSGSTGTPKGVEISHRAINRLVCNTDYYQVDATDRIAQASNVSFDAATFEIWGALLNGAQLVGIDKDVLLNSKSLAVFLQEQGISAMFLTTALFNQIAREAPDAFKGLSGLMFGGEAVDPGAVRQVLAKAPPERLLHVYGPTESTTFASWYLVEEVAADASTVPIGRPLANTTLYILDKNLNPVPVGVPGELYIGGDGLSRGYLNRPELTADKFIADPFNDDPASRLYKTGDQVRYRRDGAIEYLGRFDHQVKLRGFRVEPGEIESVLLGEPVVSDAVVIVHEDEAGDKRLVAYVVADGGEAPSESELREYVANRLPNYMVPSAFMVLDKLPLTANGKVDRNALPEPGDIRDSQGDEYTAPRTELERQLAEIWAEVLKLERVGIHDNFFDLGGHSLMATQAVSRIREQLNVELPLSEIFDYPTVAGLVSRVEILLDENNGNDADVIQVAKREDNLPLSFAQKRLWFLDQLKPGNPAYNIPLALRLKGALHINALLDSLNTILDRHEALRTRFLKTSSGPVQVIDDKILFDLAQTDLSGISAEDLEQEITSRFRAEKSQPFDLAGDCLVRGSLLRINREEHVLLLTMHHIISDGWSLGVLFRELVNCYTAISRGEQPVLPVLTIQYADFSVWQRQWLNDKQLDRQLNYWRRQLQDLQVLDLPTDRTRPAIQSYDGADAIFLIDEQLSHKLKRLSKDSGVTLFMMLLAVFVVLVHRYSNQDDIVIGSPIANRNRAELEGLIAFFVNMLVMRVDCSGNPDFKTLVKRVRDVALGAYEHQDIPFERLVDELQVKRDPSRNPLFQVQFALQDAPLETLELPGMTLERIVDETQVVHFDLECYVSKQAKGLQVSILYNTSLFEAATVQRMLEHYHHLLEQVAAKPDQSIDFLPMLGKDEKLLLQRWNRTDLDYPQDLTITQLLETQVASSPEVCAVEFSGQALSYRELDQRAGELAWQLQKHGIGPGQFVGVYMLRSLEMVIALYAVLKAGGAYVPLDPEYPRDRIAYMVEETQPSVILTQQHLQHELPDMEATVMCVDHAELKPRSSFPRLLSAGATANDLAYVIYTSGSTGKPKGVMNCHRGVVNRLCWGQQTFSLGSGDRVLQKTPFSFDVSVWEIFWPLMSGARLVIAKPEGHKDPAYLSGLIRDKKINHIHFVPSMLKVFLDNSDASDFSQVKRVFCSGEALPYELQQQFFKQSNAELHNLYGPTEAAIEVSHWACRRDDTRRVVPIGRPIANTRLHVLDRQMQPVPIGVGGELYIGGAQVARGYLGQPGLTSEKFIPDPFSDQVSARLYRTGDLVRYLANGEIVYLGRADNQVKLRGFRVELGEVESELLGLDVVKDAVVVVHQDEHGDKRLVAYLVMADSDGETIGWVREYLKRRLPEYMLPSVFMPVEKIALNSNGKVDHGKLPEPEASRNISMPVVEPTGQFEKRIAGIWKRVLKQEDVGVEDNFFDLGGDSFLMIQLHTALEEILAREIPITDLFRFSTVRSFTRYYEGNREFSTDSQSRLETRAAKQQKAIRKKRRISSHVG